LCETEWAWVGNKHSGMASIKVVAQSVVPVNMDIVCVMARRANHAMARRYRKQSSLSRGRIGHPWLFCGGGNE
jgi:hypothetical protein